jgi:hypothetical protein
MEKMFVILFVLVLGPISARCGETAAPAAKKTFNANIYEKESTQSISAKVHTIKDSRDDTLVYFDGLKKSGPYVLSGTIKNYTTLRNRLAKSAGTQGSKVTVSVDDQDNILSVTAGDDTDH